MSTRPTRAVGEGAGSEGSSPAPLWRVAAILLGVLALLLAYYWAHKPGGAPSESAALILRLGGALLDLLTVAALFAVAGSIGRVLLSRIDLAALSRPERLALEAAAGLGVASLAALAFGLLGLFRGVILWAALAVVALLLRRALRDWWRDWRKMFHHVRLETAWARFLAAAILLLLALALMRALSPPFAWDSLAYHLVAPARYLEAGRIAAHADNHFLGFPQLVEVLFGVAMSLFGRDTTPALVHYGFGLIGLLAIAGLVRRHADASAAWLAILLPASAFSFWQLLGWAYVDLALFAYGALALVAAARWRETHSSAWLVVIGVCAGFALGVKYTAAGLALALAVYLVLNAPRRALKLAVFGGAALVVFAPWLLKGALFYGNPVYPFFFGGLNWDAGRASTFSTPGTGLLGTPDAWQLVVLPLSATVFGVEKASEYDFTLNPWLLTAPLLLPVVWRWLDARSRRLALDCLILSAPLLLFWMALAAFVSIGAQVRLMAMALPLAAVMGALVFHALASFPQKPVHVSFLVRAAFALTLLPGVVEAGRSFARENTLPYLLALTSRDSFLDANLGAYASMMRRLATLPPDSRVRFMWEPRSYGCPPRVACQPDILRDYWARPLANGQAADEVLQAWRDTGDDYLLVWDTGYQLDLNDPRFAAANARFPAARDRYLIPIWTDGVRYTLYGWK